MVAKILNDVSFRLSDAGRQFDVAQQSKRQRAQHPIAGDCLRFALLDESYLDAFFVLIDFDDRRVVTNFFFQARGKRSRQVVVSTFDFAEPVWSTEFGSKKFSQAIGKTVDGNLNLRAPIHSQS